MKVVVQRSKHSSVCVDNKLVSEIDYGLVILVGFSIDDDISDINYITRKVLNLRIFDDESGIMNKSILDVGGSILSISQFTLQASTKDGNRPSYINAMKGDNAIKLYEEFNKELSQSVNVLTGIFGADMEVNITNDGPITIIIDSKNK
jgi:D-tyrosyl-tRNA(Tyr) deacylase